LAVPTPPLTVSTAVRIPMCVPATVGLKETFVANDDPPVGVDEQLPVVLAENSV
jgi:hypothetical protein